MSSGEEFLEELGRMADVQTFDWAKMNASGQGLMQSDSYLIQLGIARDTWMAQLPVLGITDEEIEDATNNGDKYWDDLGRAIVERRTVITDTIGIGAKLIPTASAIEVTTATLRTVAIYTTASAKFGTAYHLKNGARVEVQAGQMTLAEAEEEASRLLSMWTALVKLKNSHAFDLVEPGHEPTQGLGLAWYWVALIALSVIAILSELYIQNKRQDFENKARWARCFDEKGAPRSPWPSDCSTWFEGMKDDHWSLLDKLLNPLRDLTKPAGIGIGMAIVVAAAIYVGGVYVLPALTRGGGGVRRLPAPAGA